MRIQGEIILSVLKLTKNGVIQRNLVAGTAHTPTATADEVLVTLSEKDLIKLKGKLVEVTPGQRLQLAVEAIMQGVDIEHVSRFLEWKEFENMAATAFEINRYITRRNFHFKAHSKRWEMDLLACKQPLMVCVDCKHWQHGWGRASIAKAAETQVERTRALASSLEIFSEKLCFGRWTKTTLIPIVLALVPSAFKFHNGTPIVPILQLQSFINELPTRAFSLTHFSTIMKETGHKLTEF